LELIRFPTGSHFECHNQNIKAWHHTPGTTPELVGGCQGSDFGEKKIGKTAKLGWETV